jgi:hypothetical protein
LFSLPTFIAVWMNTFDSLLQGNVPSQLGSDIVKAIMLLGFFVSFVVSGYNAVFPTNPMNATIWICLIPFYTLSAIACLFPFDVNENLVSGIRSFSLFYLFLILLLIANLLSLPKRCPART